MTKKIHFSKKYILLCLSLLLTFSVNAAIPKKNIVVRKDSKKANKNFISEGVFTGGEISRALKLASLKVVPVKKSKKNREKVYIQFLNQQSKKLKELGYFHVNVEQKPPRVVIDFKHVEQTSIDQNLLDKIILRSQHISRSSITMDPEDHSTNITLYFDRSKKVRVYTPRTKSGERLFALDIIE